MARGERMQIEAEKVFTIKFPSGEITLNVNPEEYSATAPHRQEVVQTLTGVVVDAFGAGIGEGGISGTCGWGRPLAPRGKNQANLTGQQQFESLLRRYREWQDLQVQATDPSQIPCEVLNEVDNEHLEVVFTGFSYRHSVGDPFKIHFDLKWRILKDWASPFRRSALIQIGGAGGLVLPGDTPDWDDDPSGNR